MKCLPTNRLPPFEKCHLIYIGFIKLEQCFVNRSFSRHAMTVCFFKRLPAFVSLTTLQSFVKCNPAVFATSFLRLARFTGREEGGGSIEITCQLLAAQQKKFVVAMSQERVPTKRVNEKLSMCFDEMMGTLFILSLNLKPPLLSQNSIRLQNPLFTHPYTSHVKLKCLIMKLFATLAKRTAPSGKNAQLAGTGPFEISAPLLWLP